MKFSLSGVGFCKTGFPFTSPIYISWLAYPISESGLRALTFLARPTLAGHFLLVNGLDASVTREKNSGFFVKNRVVNDLIVVILQILFFTLRRQPVALPIPDKFPSFHHSLKDMRRLMGCDMKEFHEVLPTADIVL